MPSLNKLMSHNFIEYASYVIKDRAIPDIDDGLKPVQRRILHSMEEMDDGKFNKVANVVGNTMKYHPHGDASIYSSLVILANKDYFIEKQGNYGNIYTGDEASAARYIECRLSPLAKETLFKKELTEYSDSYDGRNKEPVALPAKIPNLLLLGAEGIAVGMSTKILPHNFVELLEAQIKILQNKPFAIYPDFQQGGMLDITDYQKGNGKVRIRAKIKCVDDKTLLVQEIPYGTTTESIISSIENAARKGRLKINSISDFTSETAEIEIKVARGEKAVDLVNLLYAYTDCEINTLVNLIVIVNNKPKQMNVDEVLKYNTDKLKDDLKKELEFEHAKLKQKLHEMTLERIFIENRIYKKIEEIKTYDAIIKTVVAGMNLFKELFIKDLTKEDVERLLDIKIKRISRYDIELHKKEVEEILKNLDIIEKNLANIKAYAINYLKKLIEKYGELYPRKSKIVKMEEISVREIKQPDVKVYWDTKGGFLGTDVKGDSNFLTSPYDKFLLFQKKGIFKVVSIDSKNFVDTDILYLDIYSGKTTFSVIYTDLDSKISFAKKFRLSRFITNKAYPIGPFKNVRIDYVSINPKEKVKIHYIKKPKQKVNEEKFDFNELEIKSHTARGNKISNKELKDVTKG